MLDQFFSAVRDIEDKNYGGCLFFCYVFIEWAKKNGVDLSDFYIKQYEVWGTDAIENNENFIHGLTDVAESSSHFTWVLDGTEYDGNGITADCGWNSHALCAPIPVLEKFCVKALSESVWNDTFDRKSACKVVRSNLHIRIPKAVSNWSMW